MKLIAENISKSYDGQKIIENINLSVGENEFVCILGVSGIGKSTLFNVLSGLVRPDTGNVLFSETDITGEPGYVSYMQQKDLLLPWKTVLDNVALPLIIKGISKKEARQEAIAYFEQFGIKGYEHKYPSQLSGGMRQRAALLRTYLFSSDMMLLDEPFSSLDPLNKSAMHVWYQDLCGKLNIATLFITHDIDEAILLSDRICIMSGTPACISGEFLIEITKPRYFESTTSDEFITYKKQIYAMIQ